MKGNFSNASRGAFSALYIVVIFLALVLQSCQKDFTPPSETLGNQKKLSPTLKILGSGSGNGYCWQDAEEGNIADSILKPTILGSRLIGNPYSVANMSQAYRNLTNSTTGVTENAWYVRVKPSSYDQLAAVEDLDVDWFDYPLDYELVQEGDYYDDGSTPIEQIPWLYAVVAPNFVPPVGVTYELQERIHVPNNYFLENEAFRITGNNIDTAACSNNQTLNGGFQASSTASCNCSLRPSALSCECRAVCGFDTRNCVIPLPTVPPTRIPAGAITVTDDIRFSNNLPNYKVPVRKARMVARRFLKVDRVFTDNNGNYSFTKSFRNKVSIFIKFKNDNAIVKGLRGARLWQILMPVKINMGQYRGNINNLPYNVEDNNDVRSRGARHWAAATTHNAVQEYTFDYAPQESIGVPPNKLRILIVPGNGAGSAPMFAKRFISTLPDVLMRTFVLGSVYPPLGYLNTLTSVLAGRVDVTIGYNYRKLDVTSSNDKMAELCFHELTHAGHYNKVGNGLYGDFVQAEIAEMIANFNGQFSPYGQGTNGNSPIIALGESWAYHMGHWLANSKYGALSGTFREQGKDYFNNSPLFGLNSNLNLLEDFSPNRVVEDPFWWIPQGLYYDLIDIRNESTPVLDNASNYTNLQFFNALDPDINSLPQFRLRLLQENSNTQNIEVTSLFAQYNY